MITFDPQSLEALTRRLHLATVRRMYPDLIREAERESWPYGVLLERLLSEEVSHRSQTRIERFTAKAKLPFMATIEEFDFTVRPNLKRQMLGRFLGLELVADNRSLVLEGPAGTGKTHLCIAIAYKAIQNGYEALFTTAAALINDLVVAAGNGRLADALKAYIEPDVLICDEVGYLGYGPGAADVLFQVVDQRYLKRRPILFTTNKSIKKWGKVLHDGELARAILDRTLHHGEHIKLDGPSWRLKGKNGVDITQDEGD
ncbi:MAG: transposase-associated IstB-like ATP-binding protein [Acidobacteria bacterium]|nr:transposase-associated IstB-like ATP-binding protein [Acidobacteriota bacterium]